MKAVHFDRLGKELQAHEVGGGSVSFISWRRLSEVLRAAGELRDFERTIGFQVDDRGLSVRVETTTSGIHR